MRKNIFAECHVACTKKVASFFVLFYLRGRIMKNIVFDLGGVVFARDPKKCPKGLVDFFAFITSSDMPVFWNEYDRGTLSWEQVVDALCAYHGCTREVAETNMQTAVDLQEEIACTRDLIADLKAAGYRLYVLSNMSKEFIDFLRKLSVYALFDADVVSCEEHTVKPERRIFEILLSRYGLRPCETLFIDDRPANLVTAADLGMATFLFDAHNPQTGCEKLRMLLLQNR